jgi:hypothetical protein
MMINVVFYRDSLACICSNSMLNQTVLSRLLCHHTPTIPLVQQNVCNHDVNSSTSRYDFRSMNNPLGRPVHIYISKRGSELRLADIEAKTSDTS